MVASEYLTCLGKKRSLMFVKSWTFFEFQAKGENKTKRTKDLLNASGDHQLEQRWQVGFHNSIPIQTNNRVGFQTMEDK